MNRAEVRARDEHAALDTPKDIDDLQACYIWAAADRAFLLTELEAQDKVIERVRDEILNGYVRVAYNSDHAELHLMKTLKALDKIIGYRFNKALQEQP